MIRFKNSLAKLRLLSTNIVIYPTWYTLSNDRNACNPSDVTPPLPVPDPNRNMSESREKYENHQFRQLYNYVFSTKPPHLRTSEENYIQFLKDEFFAKQKVPESPKTSRERYEWHVKKQQGSFFGGKYDFDTYLAGNFTARRRRRAIYEEGNWL